MSTLIFVPMSTYYNFSIDSKREQRCVDGCHHASEWSLHRQVYSIILEEYYIYLFWILFICFWWFYNCHISLGIFVTFQKIFCFDCENLIESTNSSLNHKISKMLLYLFNLTLVFVEVKFVFLFTHHHEKISIQKEAL